MIDPETGYDDYDPRDEPEPEPDDLDEDSLFHRAILNHELCRHDLPLGTCSLCLMSAPQGVLHTEFTPEESDDVELDRR